MNDTTKFHLLMVTSSEEDLRALIQQAQLELERRSPMTKVQRRTPTLTVQADAQRALERVLNSELDIGPDERTRPLSQALGSTAAPYTGRFMLPPPTRLEGVSLYDAELRETQVADTRLVDTVMEQTTIINELPPHDLHRDEESWRQWFDLGLGF